MTYPEKGLRHRRLADRPGDTRKAYRRRGGHQYRNYRVIKKDCLSWQYN
jgi:hypothetical protein